MTPEGRVGRSPLVIMTRDASSQRNGYSARSYLQALNKGLLPYYKPAKAFMQDNAPIHTSFAVRAYLEEHSI